MESYHAENIKVVEEFLERNEEFAGLDNLQFVKW